MYSTNVLILGKKIIQNFSKTKMLTLRRAFVDNNNLNNDIFTLKINPAVARANISHVIIIYNWLYRYPYVQSYVQM